MNNTSASDLDAFVQKRFGDTDGHDPDGKALSTGNFECFSGAAAGCDYDRTRINSCKVEIRRGSFFEA